MTPTPDSKIPDRQAQLLLWRLELIYTISFLVMSTVFLWTLIVDHRIDMQMLKWMQVICLMILVRKVIQYLDKTYHL